MAPSLFLSHKVHDRELATYVKDELIKLGFPADQVFISEEIPPGAPWRQAVIDQLHKADILILLFTDPSYDWDWCLFECGYYAGLPKKDGRDRELICVNSGSPRPSVLQHWQDVPSKEALGKVLIRLGGLTGSDLPAQPTFGAYVEGLWNAIARRVPQRSELTSQAFRQRRLSIILNAAELEEVRRGGSLPETAKVEMSDGALDIFPNVPNPGSWGQIAAVLNDTQKAWAPSIHILIRMLDGRRTPSPLLPLVQSGTASNLPIAYRPLVAQRDVYVDGSVRHTLIFVQTPDATVSKQSKPDLLFHSLMLMRNFKEGVIDAYTKRFNDATPCEEVCRLVADFMDELTLTRIDAHSRGLTGAAQVMTGPSREAINDLKVSWGTLEQKLQSLKVLAVGLLHVPGTTEAQLKELKDKAMEHLSAMRRLNDAYQYHFAGALFANFGNAEA
jgi:hypothetical protein